MGTVEESIDVVALDDFLADVEHVDLIKIDVQGAEALVVTGMMDLLKRSPGVRMLLEFCPSALRSAGGDPLNLLNELTGLGFAVRWLDRRSGRAMDIGIPEAFIGGLTGERYVNLLVARSSHA